MNINRKSLVIGLLGLGFAGAILGGVGVAVASTGQPGGGSSTAGMPCWGTNGATGMMRNGTMLKAAADYLGLTQTELRAQLRAGKTLAEIAKEQGKTLTGLRAAMADAMRDQMRDRMGGMGGMGAGGMMGW
jgi:hypothetical protein